MNFSYYWAQLPIIFPPNFIIRGQLVVKFGAVPNGFRLSIPISLYNPFKKTEGKHLVESEACRRLVDTSVSVLLVLERHITFRLKTFSSMTICNYAQ
jgi:hypothetical protein